jgi:phage terminase small subunit
MKLAPMRARFVQEYLVDLNGTQAAIRAGYSARTATITASQLLTYPNVQAELQKAFKARAARLEISQDWVLNELRIIAAANLEDYYWIDPDTGAIRAKPFEQMPAGASRALQAISEDRVIKEDAKGDRVTVYDKINFKLHDKIKALELIGKHLGMFKERVEHSGKVDSELVVKVVKLWWRSC